ncbi:hypothetical protein [Spongiactinospora sp. TRM90649]|uniref:hypothetical protein n=1 Tax=Spongiactinospora sp. TRM90649 TaxID=3031114 RepID=UPI0023F84BFC|nr:hypothetical protein [Spongiactinospora sp. TRM90649]MDF5752876.1 hypothetical protein [Spongiactinospora sp. TRM90649]
MSEGEARVRVGVCLSLSGRYAGFGRQAGEALAAWSSLDPSVELVVEDDRGEARILEALLPNVLARCDLVLGPYATGLTRAAARVAADAGRLLWNHGGAGDDVQAAHPGHLISVPTPASRYAEPFIAHLARSAPPAPLWIARGKGDFARQVERGARETARGLGIVVAEGDMPSSGVWDLLCAGSFGEDIATVNAATAAPCPPRHVCATAAGVGRFGTAADRPEGVYGMAQWAALAMRPESPDRTGDRPTDHLRGAQGRAGSPGRADGTQPDGTRGGRVVPAGRAGRGAWVGPSEGELVAVWRRVPDYPGVQAVAAAILAVYCARLAGATAREALWDVAASLDTRTFFGAFQVDPRTGVQAGHENVLVRWVSRGERAVVSRGALRAG